MDKRRETRKIGLAVVISICLHLLVGFSLAAFGGAFTPSFPVEDKPVELTIVDSSQPAPERPKNPPFMETDPSKESAEKPKDQTFESNANSIGASQNAASGDVPLPSQDGKERPFVNLETHKSSLAMDGAKPQPQADSLTREESKPSTRAQKDPQTAPSQAPAATAEPEQLAMLRSTPPPPMNPPDQPEPSPQDAVTELTRQSLPRPKPEVAASNYRAEREQTRITGNLNSRGPSSVNAVGTPFGRYQKSVSDAIGSRWYYYIKAKGDVASIGTALIHAEVDAEGHLQNLRVVSNTSNEAFANICLQSFQEAHIPPIPPELVETFPNGRFPVDFSFTMYANQY